MAGILGLMREVGSFFWRSLCRYIATRCSSDFMDSCFDTMLVTFAKSTKSKVDDEIVEKFITKREEKSSNK